MRRLLAVGTALALLGGCTASPTTTVTDGDGERSVDWADYPGHAWVEASDALATPSQAEAERRGVDVLADVERALTSRYGMTWRTRSEALWSPRSGNGYGGRSAYVTYNSAVRESDQLPAQADRWSDVVETVSAVTEEHGLGPVVLEHDRVRGQHDIGADDPDEAWVWNGLAEDGTRWLMVDLTDVHRHPDADAQRAEHERLGLPLRSVRLAYGVTTVDDAERSTFRTRLRPFEGLDKPEATESD